jgi:hypothetical protein
MQLQFISLLSGLLLSLVSIAQTEETVMLKTISGEIIEGTLTVPETKAPTPVVLIIAGSGPTDRNGNNPMMTNNSLKMLSAELVKNGIASLRYDKRGIGKSKMAGEKEVDLRFDNYIQDAIGWIKFLKATQKFTTITVVGHSEGSLIGMIAAQNENVSKIVSIAGAGQPADKIIRDQLKAQPPFVLEQASPVLDKLVKGDTVENIPPMLLSLFRPSVQPYMISWFKYDPQNEIAKLKKPVLIIQGTTDIQVGIDDAQKLKTAKPEAKLVLIDGMNHIFKNAEADRMKNIQTYNQPDVPLNDELVPVICSFINAK